MAIGATLKLIRTSKGLSQREFSKGIISNSYYSKVELGDSQLSADSLFKLLEKVNVTLAEFYFIDKKYKGERQTSLFYDIKLNVHLQNRDGLEKIWQTLIKDEIEDPYYYYIIKNLMCVMDNKSVIEEEMEEIKYYLYNVPSWGHFEFQLFSLCMNILNTETLLHLSIHVIRNAEKYIGYLNYEQDLLMILVNLTHTAILDCQLDLAEYFIKVAKQVNKNPFYIYEKLQLKFFEGVLKVKEGQVKKGESMASEVINTFASIDMLAESERLHALLLTYLKEK